MLMTLLGMAIFGFIVYLIVTYIPMPAVFQQVIIVICVIFLIFYAVRVFGIKVPGL